MNAVELIFPAAMASKLMGSDGCGNVGVRVTVEKVETRQSERVSIIVNPKVESCSSFPGQKESIAWNNITDGELSVCDNKLTSFHVEDASEDPNIGSTSYPLLQVSGLEAKQHPRKSGKVARSTIAGSKRSCLAQLEICMNVTDADDIINISKEVELSPAKCIATEKTQITKQKTYLNGKRGDKRNGRGPKGKCDLFSVKGGLASFNSSAGGNNVLEIYGSRSDIEEVTKHVDELPLKELLDGSYRCHSFAKDKGKKSAISNVDILHIIKKASTILQQKPIRPQILENDDGYYQDIVPCLLTPRPSRSGSDKGDTNMTDLSSYQKILDFPLYQHKDILDRLALPPPKDLESLLLDAAKPSVASRNNAESRLGKPVTHRGGLPPFSWSHTSAGHCKSNADAVKVSTSRTTCQGRWVKVGRSVTSLALTSDFLTELDSFTYDNSLIPLEYQKLVPSRIENNLLTPISFTSSAQGSSAATCPVVLQVSTGGRSPRLLAAAQTLRDMATHSFKQNPYGMKILPKEPSEKFLRAHIFKSTEKFENLLATPTSKTGSRSLLNTTNEARPSKKLRLSVKQKNVDIVHINNTAKGPIHWSVPRSSRSSHSKSLRDSVAETKNYNLNIAKKSCMMPPAARTSDTASSSQPKPRKLTRMEWNRDGFNLE